MISQIKSHQHADINPSDLKFLFQHRPRRRPAQPRFTPSVPWAVPRRERLRPPPPPSRPPRRDRALTGGSGPGARRRCPHPGGGGGRSAGTPTPPRERVSSRGPGEAPGGRGGRQLPPTGDLLRPRRHLRGFDRGQAGAGNPTGQPLGQRRGGRAGGASTGTAGSSS